MFVKLNHLKSMPKMQKDLDEKGEMGRMKPIGKFFRETRERTGNRGLRRIAKQKATDDRWLFVTSQTGLGLRGGSGSRQVGVVDFPIIGKGQLAAAPNKSTNFIHFLRKKNPLMTVHQRVCRFRTILIRVTERTGR